MSGIDLAEIREFAAMTQDHPNEVVYAEYVLALVAAAEAAQTVVREDYFKADCKHAPCACTTLIEALAPFAPRGTEETA